MHISQSKATCCMSHIKMENWDSNSLIFYIRIICPAIFQSYSDIRIQYNGQSSKILYLLYILSSCFINISENIPFQFQFQHMMKNRFRKGRKLNQDPSLKLCLLTPKNHNHHSKEKISSKSL